MSLNNSNNTSSTWIYVRASTENQNLDAQEFSCFEKAESLNLQVAGLVREIGSARAGVNNLNKLCELINGHVQRGDKLIVYSLDRITRNYDEAKDIFNYFQTQNIEIVSVTENSVNNKEIFLDRILLAQQESELISQRVKRSINFRRFKRDHIGGVPYGKKIVSIVTPKDARLIDYERIYNQQNEADGSTDLIMRYIGDGTISDTESEGSDRTEDSQVTDGSYSITSIQDLEPQYETDYNIDYNKNTHYLKKVLFNDIYESAIIKFINDTCNKSITIKNLNSHFGCLTETLMLGWDSEGDKLKFINLLDEDSEFHTGNTEYCLKTRDVFVSNKATHKNSKKIVVTPEILADILNTYGIHKRGVAWKSSTVNSCLQ